MVKEKTSKIWFLILGFILGISIGVIMSVPKDITITLRYDNATLESVDKITELCQKVNQPQFEYNFSNLNLSNLPQKYKFYSINSSECYFSSNCINVRGKDSGDCNKCGGIYNQQKEECRLTACF